MLLTISVDKDHPVPPVIDIYAGTKAVVRLIGRGVKLEDPADSQNVFHFFLIQK